MKQKLKVGIAALINGVIAGSVLILSLLVFFLVLDTSKPLQNPATVISLALLPTIVAVLLIAVTFTLDFRISFVEAFIEIRGAMLGEGEPMYKFYLVFFGLVSFPLATSFITGGAVNIAARRGDVLSSLVSLALSGLLGIVVGHFFDVGEVKRVSRQIRRSLNSRSPRSGRAHRT